MFSKNQLIKLKTQIEIRKMKKQKQIYALIKSQ